MSQELHDGFADWIALDWGTTHLRGWAMVGETVIGEIRSEAGMNALADRDAFEQALFEAIGPWVPIDDGARKLSVVACGMVGARQGWREASYLRVPTAPRGEARYVPTMLDFVDVAILPGVAQDDPPDVMRGEETQIAGLLAAEPDFEGLVCLPGTHTKWARIADGRIEAFRTAMTGELFDLLSTRSVLRHSVDPYWDEGLFAAAVVEGAAAPETLPVALFGIRAGQLLEGAIAGECRARLSGLLIGAELAAIASLREGVAAVRIIGAPALADHYAKALGALGQGAILHDGAETTRAGLLAAYREIGRCF
ncbi:2-dehydro-3-deoxygalactonokinase [Salinarimonas sp.]|uniref:2-dehydro-3-deoxygalactonokinase n=1 Tax=Salinarimonas sp. TaxID=2766526 RepID=UPI0032D9A2B2